ncbi:MAG: hypothetical protein GTO14_18190 [Anaerolineales bacterium]|nr:hypothetical protein [Anaerolineales bacterium]
MPKVYKVSYVVIGGEHPGAILNTDKEPKPGEQIKIGQQSFEILEVIPLVPPRGDFNYLHVTLKPADK